VRTAPSSSPFFLPAPERGFYYKQKNGHCRRLREIDGCQPLHSVKRLRFKIALRPAVGLISQYRSLYAAGECTRP
jgi:hypothetical protein